MQTQFWYQYFWLWRPHSLTHMVDLEKLKPTSFKKAGPFLKIVQQYSKYSKRTIFSNVPPAKLVQYPVV